MTVENNCVFKALTRVFPEDEAEIRDLCEYWQGPEDIGVGAGVLSSLHSRGRAVIRTRRVEPDFQPNDFIGLSDLKEEALRLCSELKEGHPLIVAINNYNQETGAGHAEALLPEDGVTREGGKKILEVTGYLITHGGFVYSVTLP